jgi:hypothetical protein
MYLARSVNGILIRLTDERMAHIISNHPEVINQVPGIIETIERPDLLLGGDYSEMIAIKLFKKTPVTENKFLAVVYKEKSSTDGFILTAYFCSCYNKRRKVLWKPSG